MLIQDKLIHRYKNTPKTPEKKNPYFLQLLSDNKREIENRPIIGKSTNKFEMTLLKFGKGAKSTVFLK